MQRLGTMQLVLLGLALATGFAAAGQPDHDGCFLPRNVSALPYSDSVPDIADAGVDGDDPAPSCTAGAREHTVWYTYNAFEDGTVRVTTGGSDFDSFVYVGYGNCGSFSEVACGNDESGDDADVTFEATAGGTYYVMAGATGALADGELQILFEDADGGGGGGGGGGTTPSGPAADTCETATEIPGVPARVHQTMEGSSSGASDPTSPCYQPADESTVWFTFTSASDQQVRIDTSDSGFNSAMTVFTGGCGALEAVDCDYNSGANSTYTHGLVDFYAEAGVTYHIMVSSAFPVGDAAEVVLDVSEGHSHPVDVTVTDATSGASIVDAHVWLRDLAGGNYTERAGFTGPDGTVRLYPTEPANYDTHVAAKLYKVLTEPVNNEGGRAAVSMALEPVDEIRDPTPNPTRVAFARNGLYTMRPDGTDEQLIVEGDCFYDPAWSPDGDRIAFAANELLECQAGFRDYIWIVDADGTDLHKVDTILRGRANNVAWSPDGQWITYDYFIPLDGVSYVFRIKADGSLVEEERLLEFASEASWSPDASMIVFTGPGGTRVARADGSHEMIVRRESGHPDWSPDGTRITVGDGSIVTFGADGSNPRTVLEGGFDTFHKPEWSPDGEEMIVVRDNIGTHFLERMNADGSSLRRIRAGGVQQNSAHDWSFWPTGYIPGNLPPEVRLLAPDGGERLRPGETFTIRWDAADDGSVASIDLHWRNDDGRWPIALGLDGGQSSYDWTVPDQPSHLNAHVEITVHDAAGQQAYHESKYPFTIAGEGDPYAMVEITYPEGGEEFHEGEIVPITWVFDSYWTETSYSLEISWDGGKTFEYIDSAVPAGTRVYDWTAPARSTAAAVLRLYQNGVYSPRDDTPLFSVNPATVEDVQADGAPSTTISWSPSLDGPTEATETYDVARGDVSQLRNRVDTPSWVDLGAVTCLENDSPYLSTVDDAVPDPGRAFFYTVRPSGDEGATYGLASDARERLASASDCPEGP
jgi:WD40 repeat protein